MYFQIETFGDVRAVKVSRTFLGRPVFFVHAFLLDGLLIDTGFAGSKKYLRRFMLDSSVRTVIITHHHEDHIGANAEANSIGIIPLVPEEGLELIRRPHALQWYRRGLWGMPDPSDARVLGRRVGTGRFDIEVIHAPGHSHDHKVFYLRERGWLFSGDVFLAEQVKYMRDDEDATVTIDTLKRLLDLDFDVLFDALRGPVHHAKEALNNKLAFLEEKQAQVRSLREKGMDLRGITDRVFGREGFMTFVSSGHFSKINFTKSLLGITKYPRST